MRRLRPLCVLLVASVAITGPARALGRLASEPSLGNPNWLARPRRADPSIVHEDEAPRPRAASADADAAPMAAPSQAPQHSATGATPSSSSAPQAAMVAGAGRSPAPGSGQWDQPDQSTNASTPLPVLDLSALQAAQMGFYRHSVPVSVILTIAYTMVFIVGIVGNSFVVAIVCKSPRMRTVTNYFIANLACADILVLLFCLPATLVSNLFIPYVLGLFVCKTVSYLQGIAVSASINTMVAFTLDRFLAICFPMDWHMSRRTARWTIACIWVFSFSISLPWALYFHLEPFEHRNGIILICAEDWPSKHLDKMYFICANLILLYLLPATVIILCYLGIWYKIERRNIPGDRPRGLKIELIMQKSKLKVVKMMMLVVVIFLLSWLPLYLIVARLKLAEEHTELEEWLIALMPLAQWLGASNSCINPILYTFFNRKYKTGFIDLLRLGLCCGKGRAAGGGGAARPGAGSNGTLVGAGGAATVGAGSAGATGPSSLEYGYADTATSGSRPNGRSITMDTFSGPRRSSRRQSGATSSATSLHLHRVAPFGRPAGKGGGPPVGARRTPSEAAPMRARPDGCASQPLRTCDERPREPSDEWWPLADGLSRALAVARSRSPIGAHSPLRPCPRPQLQPQPEWRPPSQSPSSSSSPSSSAPAPRPLPPGSRAPPLSAPHEHTSPQASPAETTAGRGQLRQHRRAHPDEPPTDERRRASRRSAAAAGWLLTKPRRRQPADRPTSGRRLAAVAAAVASAALALLSSAAEPAG